MNDLNSITHNATIKDDVLRNVATALSKVSNKLEDLERHLFQDNLVVSVNSRSTHIYQSIDYISQYTQELTIFLVNLSRQNNENILLETLNSIKKVKLENLREELMSGLYETCGARPEGGNIYMFE